MPHALPMAAIAVMLSLCGCSWIPGSDAELIEEAESRIAQELRDPSSAQFREVRASPDKSSRKIGMVCGEVNGKNAFGAYVGYRRFLYGRDANLAQIEYLPQDKASDDAQAEALAQNRQLFDATWNDSC